MPEKRFQDWIAALGAAWEARDPDAAAALFGDGRCTLLREWRHGRDLPLAGKG